MDAIHLLCAADENYGSYAGIMLASVLESNPGEKFHVHLFSNGIRASDHAKIHSLFKGGVSTIDIQNVGPLIDRYGSIFPHRFHLSKTACARILLGQILSQDIRYVLYLDCDVICIGRLRPLWNLRQTISLLAAVEDEAPGLDRLKHDLGLEVSSPYFNTGVLLINVEHWRAKDIGDRLVRWLAKNQDKAWFPDQDAMNAELQDEIYPLSRQWNFQLGSIKDRNALSRDTCLLHFNGGRKPWHFRTKTLGIEHFHRAKRKSPWRFLPPNFSYQYYKLRKSATKRLRRLSTWLDMS